MVFFYLFVIQPNGVRLEFLEVNFILISDCNVMFRRPVLLIVRRGEGTFIVVSPYVSLEDFFRFSFSSRMLL